MAILPEHDVELGTAELWTLVRTITRELHTTKTRLEAMESENIRLREELEAVRGSHQSDGTASSRTLLDEGEMESQQLSAAGSASEDNEILDAETVVPMEITNEELERHDMSQPEGAVGSTSHQETDPSSSLGISSSSLADNDRCFIPSATTMKVNDLPEVDKPDWIHGDFSFSCHTKDPIASIERDLLISCNAQEPLYCDLRLFWSSPRRQHAFLVSPTSLYHHTSSEQRWKMIPGLDDLIGQTREIFYRHHGLVYYAGTYKCLESVEITPSEHHSLASIRKCILNDTVAPAWHVSSKNTKSKIYKTVADSYLSGEAKLTSFTLQCVGFNRALHFALLLRLSKKKRRNGPDSGTQAGAGVEPSMKKVKTGLEF